MQRQNVVSRILPQLDLNLRIYKGGPDAGSKSTWLAPYE